MKILFLTKRQTTNNDILDDRFGRIWELSQGLALAGHQVEGLCLSYSPKKEGAWISENISQANLVKWTSYNCYNPQAFGFIRFACYSSKHTRLFQPDMIIGFSDPLYCILARLLSKAHHLKYVLDLQDNYEAYASYRLPGIQPLFRSAIKNAKGIVMVSEALKKHIRQKYLMQGKELVVENGVNHKTFYPLDKTACRKQLGLPLSSKIIGYAGALNEKRGIKIVFDAFEVLKKHFNELHLAVAGPRDIEIPIKENLHDFKTLDYKMMPFFINALDLAIICNRDHRQYSYGFPVKFYEVMACQVPLVATRIEPLESLLSDFQECLYEQDDLYSFVQCVSKQLKNPSRIEFPILSWDDLSVRLHRFLDRCKLDESEDFLNIE